MTDKGKCPACNEEHDWEEKVFRSPIGEIPDFHVIICENVPRNVMIVKNGAGKWTRVEFVD